MRWGRLCMKMLLAIHISPQTLVRAIFIAPDFLCNTKLMTCRGLLKPHLWKILNLKQDTLQGNKGLWCHYTVPCFPGLYPVFNLILGCDGGFFMLSGQTLNASCPGYIPLPHDKISQSEKQNIS